MRTLTLALTFLFLPTIVFAQTVLRVPLETGQFAWDNPAGTTATEHVVVCGTTSVVVPMPADTIAVSAVVPGPGSYACTLYAQNSFDKSPGSDPAFPVFTAGYVPLAPIELRLEIR